jgi:lipopolysaccharide biosynthesis protein
MPEDRKLPRDPYFSNSSIQNSLGWEKEVLKVKRLLADIESRSTSELPESFISEANSFLNSMVASANEYDQDPKESIRYGWGVDDAPAIKKSAAIHRSRAKKTNPNSGQRIAVIVHLHYPDLWSEIVNSLARIEEHFSIFVTITKSALGIDPVIESRIKRDFPEAFVFNVENRGRDIGPLFFLLEKYTFLDYSVILKIHSKKSLHRPDGNAWRDSIFESLLPAYEKICDLVSVFENDPKCGVALGRNEIKGRDFWGSNLPMADKICGGIGLEFDPARIVFPTGSMFWIRPFILERLLDLGIVHDDFSEEIGHIDGQLEHVVERLFGILVVAGGFVTVPMDQIDVRASLLGSMKKPESKKVFAFYLPQFHQIPENDEWWGKGFTEWTKVNATSALFPNHAQPLLPTDLGQYDLSDPQVLGAQWNIAKNHGLNGFIFHHYWFSGKKLLETPIESLLQDKSLDIPFAINWANETWTRRWDGLENEILIKQSYDKGWEEKFVDDIAPFLMDERYILIDGRPLLVMYRVGQFPEPEYSLGRIRNLFNEKLGNDPYIVAVLPNPAFETIPESSNYLIDAYMTFPPNSGITASRLNPNNFNQPAIYSYKDSIETDQKSNLNNKPLFRTVFPGWDNTARRGIDGHVFHGGSPISFRRSLNLIPEDSEVFFVNAWNEWAEGAVLEPSNRFGAGNLEAIRDYL